jgi:hypothetical protein
MEEQEPQDPKRLDHPQRQSLGKTQRRRRRRLRRRRSPWL